MNYFIEGLQGSGKSTLVRKLSEKYPELKVITEGDYSPIELAWCAKVSKEKYNEILDKYSSLRNDIEQKSHEEDDGVVICYTKVITDNHSFYQDMEQYEIYNGRIPFDEFKKTVLARFSKWNGDNTIFECSLFQNIIEDMILFRVATDSEIMDLYKEIARTLEGKKFHIAYIESVDIPSNIAVIRKERSDDKGNEMWFPLMMGFFDNSPYAKSKGVSGEEELYKHFKQRQDLELKILSELFEGHYTVIRSKAYDTLDI